MVSRRSFFDPLEASSEARWLVVQDRQGTVQVCRRLDGGVDVKRVFVAAMLERIDAGWALEEFSSRSGVFFCTRGVERHMVSVMPRAPNALQRDQASRLGVG
jgi:hypothetical protein